MIFFLLTMIDCCNVYRVTPQRPFLRGVKIETRNIMTRSELSQAMRFAGRLGGLRRGVCKGLAALSPERRREIARLGVAARRRSAPPPSESSERVKGQMLLFGGAGG